MELFKMIDCHNPVNYIFLCSTVVCGRMQCIPFVLASQ